MLLIIFSGSTTGVLRTIDSVSIDISDNSATAGESIDIEGTVTGTGITAIRISHREDGEVVWQTLDDRVFTGRDCSDGCSISDTFSRDSPGTEEFQIKAEAGKLSENSLVRPIEFTEQEDATGSLEVHVEDNDGMNGKEMEDARVELSDGVTRGPKYTDSNGEVEFNDLPANTDIDIEVKCYGETENEYNIEIESGEQRQVDINFEESFESSVCGEETDPGPTASFSYSPTNPETEQWVNLDASDSEGDIEEYRWNFGDGDTNTDDDPDERHRYNNEGEYTVELTVEEEDGDTDSTTETLEVISDDENSAPEVDLDRPSNGQEIELPYRLRWSVSDPDGDDVESTVFIAEERNDESTLDDEYIIRKNVGTSESFRLSSSDLSEGDYMWGIEATDENGATTFSDVRSFEVTESRDIVGNGNLNVFVEDSDGDPIRDARVVVDNENWFSQHTDRDGQASFEVQSGNIDITVSKDGYRTKTQTVSIDPNQDREISFTLREIDRRDRSRQARLDIHVEDDGYDELEDARVTVENGDREIRYTGSDGDARFYLDSDDYDIEVECKGERESRSTYLSEGERESIDIRFDEDFNSDLCRSDDTDRPDDEDDGSDSEGLAITDVSYPNSVCGGGSFTVDMRIENRGGFHELVTITGSGLGSINTGQSFALDVAETKSATLRFTNVQGNGREGFDIRATNHVSDQTRETINVRDCGAQIPDDGGNYFDSGAARGITAEFSPDQTVVGSAVKVKGYVDGIRGRSQVTIRANGERKARVSTQPDGYYSTYIRLNQVGDNIIRVSSGQAETSGIVTAVPTTEISGIRAPSKVFESETFEVCSNINSQIEPQVFLTKNGEIVDSKFGNGEVCFNTEASEPGEHEYQIKTLTYGKESSSIEKTVEVLELGNEVTNFPNQIATVESESGMIKVDLYNTHNDTRNYKVKLNGIRTTWLSQSQEDVILTKGEKETVYFYITPIEEGTFEPTVTVVSQDTTIYSEQINVYAGGTKNPKKTSFFDRMSQFFNL